MSEMKEEEDYFLYRSGPSDGELEDLREKEKEREEKSWDMLRNLIIILDKDHKPFIENPETPASPGPLAPQ